MRRLCYQRVDSQILERAVDQVSRAISAHDRECQTHAPECAAAVHLRNVLFVNHTIILNAMRDLLDVRKELAL